MKWHTPPSRRGQIVEVAYADAGNGLIYKRIHDRADGSTGWYVADGKGCGCRDDCDCFAPWVLTPRGFYWHQCAEPDDDADEE
jgi:hypothetical protein